MTATAADGSVLVVLVVHDGLPWLGPVLDALESQTHAAMEIVAVDNASGDGSREVLLERLGEERVLVADRDLGFGPAVSMALDASGDRPTEHVLLVHDDLALAPDATTQLVAALADDPRLAIVGPKLQVWGGARQLQSVGWTIDVTGRADSRIDPGELDQGQRDQESRTLYVSTAGMLVRRRVLEELGRFDPRYHVFRDDLDLCWRAWLAGHDVEVVPAAVGQHAGGASNYLRLGQTRFLGPRYFAERNTLATLLKNHGTLRLLAVVPLFAVVGLAKVVGFLLTRRVSDAWQTVRAWLWNLVHLRQTLRLRRRAQALRRRADGELTALFSRIGPRVRAYAEAMGSWVSGGDVAPRARPGPTPARPGPRSVRRGLGLLRRRPALVVGVLLLVLLAAAAWPLLLPGELRGGQLAAWPESPAAFLADYVAGWHEAGAFGTATSPSPAQALLGLLQVAAAGSGYVASRLLLLGPLLVAWVLALRAAQGFSRRRLPRVAAATAYVLSPPAVAALTTGRVGALVVLAVLPGIVAGGLVLARRRSAPDRAWRAVAAVALLGAVGAAFEPLLLVAIGVAAALIVGIGLLTAPDQPWRRALLARGAVAGLAPAVLLLPWSLDWALGRIAAPYGGTQAGDELWRWLLLSPSLEGFPGPVVGAGFLLAGLLGLLFGLRRRPAIVAGLWATALAGAVAGWWLDRTLVGTWPGVPLLLTAVAFAGLFALAFATGEQQLSRHAFGWRQVAAATTVLAVLGGMGSVAASLLAADWQAYARDEPVLPSFVRAAAAEEGPFRVLLLTDREGVVAWEVVDGAGPSMAAHGLTPDPVPRDEVESAVEDVLSGRDPRAGDRLGLLGVRHVIVPEGRGSEELSSALLAQTGLEPRPVPEGELFTSSSWLPVGSVLVASDLERIEEVGYVPEGTVVRPLAARGGGRYAGVLPQGAGVLVSEAVADGWQARVSDPAGATVRVTSGELLRFPALPEGTVRIEHLGTTTRGLAVTGQLLAVLLTISLALRPPRFARAHPAPSGGGAGIAGGGPEELP